MIPATFVSLASFASNRGQAKRKKKRRSVIFECKEILKLVLLSFFFNWQQEEAQQRMQSAYVFHIARRVILSWLTIDHTCSCCLVRLSLQRLWVQELFVKGEIKDNFLNWRKDEILGKRSEQCKTESKIEAVKEQQLDILATNTLKS